MSEYNGVKIFLPLEIKLLLQEDGAKTGQLSAQVILSILTDHYKDRLLPDAYNELRTRYSLSAQASKRAKQQAQAQKQKKPKPFNKLRNDILDLKEKIITATIRINDPKYAGNKPFLENRKKDFEEQLKMKEAFLAQEEARENSESTPHKNGRIKKHNGDEEK